MNCRAYLVCVSLTLAHFWTAHGALELRRVHPTEGPGFAAIRVHSEARSTNRIPREITGKFAEHLGWNIYNGMDAQILRNPTFADYPFWTGEMTAGGVTKFHVDESRIVNELKRQAVRFGWPDTELTGLTRARTDGMAAFWTRAGVIEDVELSPDTGPHGGRAQRVQVKTAGQGVAQWTWLPLHRQREFECEVMGRSPEVRSLTVALWGAGEAERPIASVRLDGLGNQWGKLRGRLRVPEEAPAADSYRLTITADAPGQLVLRHVFLRPADHIDGADPDIVKRLKESGLPLLRWPGGNFVSAYHWEDGIGPVEQRPTRPNYAWGGVEPNTFGADEFIAFCRAVGCEPMICINAGSGTPAEAARWIEYCNGPATSPMGKVRARNGHPEAYGVRHWEVGNELWGKWQMNWTTAAGYVDRYKQFAPVMLQADPSIVLYSCGAPAMWGRDWNQTLITGAGASLGIITDHPLIGGDVLPSASPSEVFRDFMAVPEVLQQKWSELRDALAAGGVAPRLAVTELQVFAHLARTRETNAPVRLTHETLPGQGSITEALYDVLVYHAAIRLGSFVELITHSAVVNHGGGLRKERERVWANPCHYAQAAFAALGGAFPVPVEIETSMEPAPMVLPDLRKAAKAADFGEIDALAAVAEGGATLVSIVNRALGQPVRVQLALEGLKEGAELQAQVLSAEQPWSGNSLESPEAVVPRLMSVKAHEGVAEFELPPFSFALLRSN